MAPTDCEAGSNAPGSVLSPEDLSRLHPFARELPPLIAAQCLKADRLKNAGVRLYPNSFRPSSSSASIVSEFGLKSREELEELSSREDLTRTVAGRIMAKRVHGKTVFLNLLDSQGKIQLYARRDEFPEDAWNLVKELDLGDIVGVAGKVFKTKTGELTLHLNRLELVTKSLWPLPEKYHEMDVELKYRRRYVDLFMNGESRKVFVLRSRIVDYLRRFMSSRGFLEVETPMLHPIPGGAKALPFATRHNALKQDFFLRIAPELYLKRLLVGGFDRVFELNRNFRNEGLSVKHNPEFTMMEFYQSYADYQDLMRLTEEMLSGLAFEIFGSWKFVYQGQEIDFTPPFKRVGYADSLCEIGGAPPEVRTDPRAALLHLQKIDPAYEPKGEPSLVALQEALFDRLVERNITDPVFLTSYPTEMSPLARRNDANPNITDRFELVVAGREIANAFSELNDALDQYDRFLAQVEEGERGDPESMRLDKDYVRALMYGMPPAAGEGVGVDRLVMLLTDSANIRDVIFFPQMRPEAF
ncbi:MAG: lysine--tRNA ligase [Deltaproteobacteria bacterium]|jgi:lysyl-tRNA synthetase class 2|nr:lysine--tRNA ligase [Deltaproteobacteria bacterium]